LPDSFLQTTTHRSPEWWVATIQQLIADASSPSEDPNHDTTDGAAWLKRLVDTVLDGLPPSNDYDGNMRAGAILSQALFVWYVRLHRAKWSDPRRPLELRQRAYEGWLAFVESTFAAVVDVRNDPVAFSGQEWDHPYSPKARSGGFV
jgi:hypothetical protein